MDSRTDRLYRLVELLPNLPLWGGEEGLPVDVQAPLAVESRLSSPDLPLQVLTQTGLSEQELEILLEADRLAGPLALPRELLQEERWLSESDLAHPPAAWWRLSLPLIGPKGTLLLLELCTPSRVYALRYFSPRFGCLQRLT